MGGWRVEGGGKNNPGLTEKEGGPVETDDLAHSLCFSGRFCSGRKVESERDKETGR